MVLVLTAGDVSTILSDAGSEIRNMVRETYTQHESGRTEIPLAAFLRIPRSMNRIIALPAYLAGRTEIAGVKWVASFAANLEAGLPRASASILLNHPETGRLRAIVEGTEISLGRTAVSALLAAEHLHPADLPVAFGVVGCGALNRRVVKLAHRCRVPIDRFVLFDKVPAQARALADELRLLNPALEVVVAESLAETLRSAHLLSFATTAQTPYVEALPEIGRPRTILHLSLRDLSPEVIVQCDNVVDDVEHVTREGTSVSLACRRYGHRDFISTTIGQLLLGRERPRATETVAFSPFGLGALDVAVADLVVRVAERRGVGRTIDDFHSIGTRQERRP